MVKFTFMWQISVHPAHLCLLPGLMLKLKFPESQRGEKKNYLVRRKAQKNTPSRWLRVSLVNDSEGRRRPSGDIYRPADLNMTRWACCLKCQHCLEVSVSIINSKGGPRICSTTRYFFLFLLSHLSFKVISGMCKDRCQRLDLETLCGGK